LCRKKEREKKRLTGGKKAKPSKGKKTATKPKKKEPKKAEKKIDDDDDDDDDDMPDTSKDAALAADLALGRTAKNRDVSGVKAKKKLALDKLRKARIGATTSKKDEEEDDDLDYGDDNDEDSDDGDEAFEPWVTKKAKISRLAELGRGDSDDDSDGGKREKSQRAFVEADLSDFAKVTVPRRRLSRWCNEPFFEDAVVEFYVRLAIGRDNITQKPCYRLCKVVGVETGRQYQFPPSGDSSVKPVRTFHTCTLSTLLCHYGLLIIFHVTVPTSRSQLISGWH